MVFQEDVKELSFISVSLLRKLEPEPVYVKDYIEEVCRKIQKEGWLEQERGPWIRTFEQEKYTLRVAFIHARRGEHITGADLAFELKDKKVIFVQSKRVGSDSRIHFNRFQLQKLIELEGQICSLLPPYSSTEVIEWMEIMHYFYHKWLEKYYRYKYPLFVLFSPFLLPYYSPFRVAFYHLVMVNKDQIEERFFHTSEIAFALGGNKTVPQKEFLNQGLKPNEFQEMFWECKIGGPDIKEDLKKQILEGYCYLTNRLIIWLHVEEK
jgi:hypothetical protein